MVRLVQPRAPSASEFALIYNDICDRGIFTNNGHYLIRFEEALCKYTGLDDIVVVNSATSGLILALLSMQVSGTVITTPFTFAATANSIVLSNLQLRFGDLHSRTFNLDPDKLSSTLLEEASSILSVLCYGNTHGANKLVQLAKKHSKPILFDAAHAFGIVDNDGESVLRLGTISVTSFHATKVLNAIEGGALYSSDKKIMKSLRTLRNFGLSDSGLVSQVGFNAKMSELHAAIGLLNLEYLDEDINTRLDIVDKYNDAVNSSKYLRSALVYNQNFTSNGSYYPIVVETSKGGIVKNVMQSLHDADIQFRRYFYPAIPEHPAYSNTSNSISDDIFNDMQNVLCIPIHPFLTSYEIDLVCKVLEEN